MRIIRVLLSFLLLTAVAACSGSDTSQETTTTTEATTTTEPTTTTTEATTTTTTPLPAAPYTGEPFDGDEAALTRPAVVVKIDNHPRARPQTGLDRADMVIEERAEGVTRFLAVYHSDLPEPVGPVRSARTSDFDLLAAFDMPVFAYSGANAIVDRGLGALPIYARYEDRVNFFRAENRSAPHNLYLNTRSLQDETPAETPSPRPWFEFLPVDQPSDQGREISGVVTVLFRESPVVDYQWDPSLGGWLRKQDGAVHSTVGGDQLAPANVVIMSTRYTVSAADANSPELVSVGSGPLVVLTDGRAITGTWTRQSDTEAPQLVDDAGDTILLSPGQVWVEYPDRSVILPES